MRIKDIELHEIHPPHSGVEPQCRKAFQRQRLGRAHHHRAAHRHRPGGDRRSGGTASRVARAGGGATPRHQSLLLARRLIEVGVPVVQVNVGRVQNWDSHSNIFPTLKDRLLPPLDQGVSALLEDLAASGLLDDTLVLMMGEFGRTPKISKRAAREHWQHCYFSVWAGGGV